MTDQRPAGCTRESPPEIIVITIQQELYGFDPSSARFRRIAELSCTTGESPFSMAVRRDGTAFSLFGNGHLFAIDTKTGACVPTSFDPAQLGGDLFGMGYVANADGSGETLYVARRDAALNSPAILGYLSTDDFRLHLIGKISSAVVRAELTGTGSGRLFAYSPPFGSETQGQIGEIERSSGRVVASDLLDLPVLHDEGFAVAQWGGQFWIFRSGAERPGPYQSFVWRYRPTDQSLVPVGDPASMTDAQFVVGAGVSGCAPL
jgi:hypothetical protein